MFAPVQPQLPSVVARAATMDASLFKPGQVLEALVLGKAPDGMVALRIGDVVVTAQLPQTLPPGTTLQLQVKVGGPAPQLAVVGTPQMPVAQPPAPVLVPPQTPVLIMVPPTTPAVPQPAAQPSTVQPPVAPASAPLSPTAPSPPTAQPPVSAQSPSMPQPPAVQVSTGPQANAVPMPVAPPSAVASSQAVTAPIVESRQPVAPLSASIDSSARPGAPLTAPAASAATNVAQQPAATAVQPLPSAPSQAAAVVPPTAPPSPAATIVAASPPPLAANPAALPASPPTSPSQAIAAGTQNAIAAAPAPSASTLPQSAFPAQAAPPPLASSQSSQSAASPAAAAASPGPPPALTVAPSVAVPQVLASVRPAASPRTAAPQPQQPPSPQQAPMTAAPMLPAVSAAPAGAPAPAVPVPATAEPATVSPLLVAQSAPRQQPTSADLPRPPVLPPGSPQAQSQPAPATPAAALAQMVPEAMARQNSLAPLLSSLATLVALPGAVPEPVLRAAVQVLAQRVPVPASGPTAQTLESAIAKSGIFLEAGLAKAAPAADLKSALVALKGAAATWLGGNPAPVTPAQQAAPPLRGMPPRAEPADLPPLPEAPREAARAIHSQADSALSRVKLMQMASLPDADPARAPLPELRMEVPFLIGQQVVMAQFQVLRDRQQQRSDGKRGWTMRFAMNFAEAGEVGAEVGLLGRSVNVALWAADPDTAADLEAALPELAPALAALGLEPGAVRVRSAPAEQSRASSGHFVDSRR